MFSVQEEMCTVCLCVCGECYAMAKGLMVCCSVFSPINDLSSGSSFISAHEKVATLGSGHTQPVDSWNEKFGQFS